MKKYIPPIFSVLFGAVYLIPAIILKDTDWVIFKLGLFAIPVWFIQMIGMVIVGGIGTVILTTLFFCFVGLLVGLVVKMLFK